MSVHLSYTEARAKLAAVFDAERLLAALTLSRQSAGQPETVEELRTSVGLQARYHIRTR